jgi:chemotaxis protein CheX
MRVEFINPFVLSTQNVFKTMLGKSLTRGNLCLNQDMPLTQEVIGMIGLCGQCQGMVAFSIGHATAMKATELMIGAPVAELNSDVMDTVGELTNMIAGAAKTQLAAFNMSISLPTVICGQSNTISFPTGSAPIVIPFESDIGPICIKVGLIENSNT